eukprot:jgi/Botrbrau1/3581/Bobra.0078s0034.2
MAAAVENYCHNQGASALGAAFAPGSPVQLPPISNSRVTRTLAGQRAPQSPPSPIAANRTTGRVAYGPWNGAFQPSPLVADIDSDMEQTIYMSEDGHGHLDLPMKQQPTLATPPAREPQQPMASSEAPQAPEETGAGAVAEPVPTDQSDRLSEVESLGIPLPGFGPRSRQRAEKKALLSEHLLVAKKGESPPILQSKSASPAVRQVFQPRRAY